MSKEKIIGQIKAELTQEYDDLTWRRKAVMVELEEIEKERREYYLHEELKEKEKREALPKTIQPLTKELLFGLSPNERHHAIINYHNWLKDVRKQDFKVELSQFKRVERFRLIVDFRLVQIHISERVYYRINIIMHYPYYSETIS